MIGTLHPDGTITANPSGAPTSFLPDGSGFRVVMRFIQASEGLPTYNGLLATFATYAAVLAHYADYNTLMTDSALAINWDVDIACAMTGTAIRSGRQGLFTEIQAATVDLSVYDPHGLFDPRSVNTALGPGRRVRAGTWVQVSVWPRTGTGWVPILTGLVDTWTRNIAPEDSSDVRVNGSDFFQALGAAGWSANPAPAQLTGARVDSLLIYTWNSAWAPTSLTPGTVTLDSRTFDNENVLDLAKAAAAVEDGRLYVAGNGTLMFQDATWRANRHPKITFLGLGASDFESGNLPCTYNVIAALVPSYADVLSGYLTYNDLKTCTVTGSVTTIPLLCASKMAAEDSSDDVVNDVTLEYQAPQSPTGFVVGTNTKVVSNAPTLYNAQDADSIKRYGMRSLRRSDLTPQSHATVLPPLASRLVARWKEGDATITTIEVDLAAAGARAAELVTGLYSGDLVNVVDVIPGDAVDAWTVSTAEIASMAWQCNPDHFTLTLTLDEIRSVAA